jgi:formyltetrahydrofolate-dependent phosphoribosylglycinamide formyltransferase
MSRVRTAILISGRGSNMSALIEAARAPDYPAEIVLVLSERADAGGLAAARAAGVSADVVAWRGASERAAFEAELDRRLRAEHVEVVCLAGFMRILSADFVARWRNRIINIHPSLLPAFPGLDTHARAIAAGATAHGATVHHVSAEVDAGPIVAQAVVPVLPGDTPEALAARVLQVEHRLYPEALRQVASRVPRLDNPPAAR